MATEPAVHGATGGFSPQLFVGFAIASIGGPLALANLLPATSAGGCRCTASGGDS